MCPFKSAVRLSQAPLSTMQVLQLCDCMISQSLTVLTVGEFVTIVLHNALYKLQTNLTNKMLDEIYQIQDMTKQTEYTDAVRMKASRAGKMAQWIEHFLQKPEDLSVFPLESCKDAGHCSLQQMMLCSAKEPQSTRNLTGACWLAQSS